MLLARICLLLASAGLALGQSTGSTACPCLRSSMLADFGITGNIRPTIAGTQYDYGASYGFDTCAAHDNGRQPYCAGGEQAAPGWCAAQWCYVDSFTCDTGLPPFQSVYFFNLFYSYQTCGAENTFDSQFRDTTAGGARPLPDIATVASDYVKNIVTELENNEAELNSAGVGVSCSFDSSCPCCSCSRDARWGSAPGLTFQQTLTKPLGNNAVPGIDACLGDVVGETFQRIASAEANAGRVG